MTRDEMEKHGFVIALALSMSSMLPFWQAIAATLGIVFLVVFLAALFGHE